MPDAPELTTGRHLHNQKAQAIGLGVSRIQTAGVWWALCRDSQVRTRPLPGGFLRCRLALPARKEHMSVQGDARDVIQAAALAYLEGDAGFVANHLHPNAHVLGSEQGEQWRGHAAAKEGLKGELGRIAAGEAAKDPIVMGTLVTRAKNARPSDVDVYGNNTAVWSATGTLTLEQRTHQEASWSVVLNRSNEKAKFQIVHSYFSIHR